MAVKRDVNSFFVRTVSEVFFSPILCVRVAFCVVIQKISLNVMIAVEDLDVFPKLKLWDSCLT